MSTTRTSAEAEELIAKLQAELKQRNEKDEKIKVQKQRSYKKRKAVYNSSSTLDIIQDHIDAVPDYNEEIVEYINSLDTRIQKAEKRAKKDAENKGEVYEEFELPKNKTKFFRHLAYHTDKLFNEAEKPGPLFMEVSLDMILEGESFVLEKTAETMDDYAALLRGPALYPLYTRFQKSLDIHKSDNTNRSGAIKETYFMFRVSLYLEYSPSNSILRLC